MNPYQSSQEFDKGLNDKVMLLIWMLAQTSWTIIPLVFEPPSDPIVDLPPWFYWTSFLLSFLLALKAFFELWGERTSF